MAQQVHATRVLQIFHLFFTSFMTNIVSMIGKISAARVVNYIQYCRTYHMPTLQDVRPDACAWPALMGN